MKKSLVALAALAVVGSAFAQSQFARSGAAVGAEMFGGVDIRYNTLSATGAGSLARMDNGGEYSPRLGWRGMEDLGGGWSAGFWLEMGFNPDDGRGSNTTANNTNMGQNFSAGSGSLTGGTGTTGNQASPSSSSLGGLQGLMFNRASTISLLNKDLGELRVGRDYAPSFWNLTIYDPFGAVGVGSATNTALGTLNPTGNSVAPPGTARPQIRTSNSAGILSNNYSGFTAQAQIALSEVPDACAGINNANSDDGRANSCVATGGDGKYTGFRLAYNNGPVSVAYGSGKTTYAATQILTGANTNITNGNVLNPGGNIPFAGNYTARNLGASYDLGMAKLWYQNGKQILGAGNASSTGAGAAFASVAGTSLTANAASPEQQMKHSLMGISVPMGATTLKFSQTKATRVADGTVVTAERIQTQNAFGAVYAFSKRTSVYATASTLSATGTGATASMALTTQAASATVTKVKAEGMDIGISHRF